MSDRALKVSLIMPTYRRGHAIHETVGMIIDQTYPHWELIVSNNGTDPLRFEDERINVIDSSAVVGAAYARNQAIPHATGDVVGYFDDDDEMYPDYIESFVREFASSDDVKMVKCDMIYRGVLNQTYGTPTAMVRRPLMLPLWQGIIRQDQHFWRGIMERHGITEGDSSFRKIDRPLLRAKQNPQGGLRAGQL